jgi:membrane-bound lytic murein transglycosylase B
VTRHDGDVIARWNLVLAVLWLWAGPARADERGWRYLIDKLVTDGVAREQVEAAFDDPRVDAFTGIEFSANPPREARARYRRFLQPASVAAAHRCRVAYAEHFEGAQQRYGVSADLVAAIIYVESGCGRNTGSSVIFYRLARLAMANEPQNVQRNLERWASEDGGLDADTAARLRRRAHYLEDTFYPEVRALFAVADRMGVQPVAIRGSISGAFGYPQFLPRSYLEFGVDADGDGRVSLYDTADAAASCARYFAGHGWRPDLSPAQRRAAVWQYNHSDAYVDTVLALAARINTAPRAPTKASSSHRRSTHRPHRAAAHHKTGPRLTRR